MLIPNFTKATGDRKLDQITVDYTIANEGRLMRADIAGTILIAAFTGKVVFTFCELKINAFKMRASHFHR